MTIFLNILGLILILYDLRYRSVPLGLLITFCFSWILWSWPALYLTSGSLGLSVILICLGFELAKKRPFLGIADKILIAILPLGIPPSGLGLYFVEVGSLGILFAVFWKKFKKKQFFPFIPALLIPALAKILFM